VWGTNICLDIRTLRNSQTCPKRSTTVICMHGEPTSEPALLLLLRLFRLDGTGTFIEMDVRRKQNMPGLTIMTFFSLCTELLKSIYKKTPSKQAFSLSLSLSKLYQSCISETLSMNYHVGSNLNHIGLHNI